MKLAQACINNAVLMQACFSKVQACSLQKDNLQSWDKLVLLERKLEACRKNIYKLVLHKRKLVACTKTSTSL